MDDETILDPNDFAVCVTPLGQVGFAIPEGNEDDEMPNLWIALMATALELQDDPERCAAVAAAWMNAAAQ